MSMLHSLPAPPPPRSRSQDAAAAGSAHCKKRKVREPEPPSPSAARVLEKEIYRRFIQREGCGRFGQVRVAITLVEQLHAHSVIVSRGLRTPCTTSTSVERSRSRPVH
jgi:hypothetical protein